MNLDEALEYVTKIVRFVKSNIDGEVLDTFVHAFRDDESIAVMHCRSNREHILSLARMSVTGLGADMIVVTWDGIGGKTVQADSLVSTVYTRTGEMKTIRQPYRLIDGTVEWMEQIHPEAGVSFIDRPVADYFAQPTLSTLVDESNQRTAEQLGDVVRVGPGRISALTEAAVYRRVSDYPWAGLQIFFRPGSAREEDLRYALEIYGLTNLIRREGDS